MRLTVLFVALALAACGGSSTTNKADAKIATADAPNGNNPDAPNNTPDAAMAGTANFDYSVCTPGGAACPLANNECLTNGTGATKGTCTATCGMTQTTTAAPMGGNAACMAAYKGSGGTPGCFAYTGTAAPYTWYCAVACGTYMGQNLGTCPTGEKCTLQTGQTYGFCDPM